LGTKEILGGNTHTNGQVMGTKVGGKVGHGDTLRKGILGRRGVNSKEMNNKARGMVCKRRVFQGRDPVLFVENVLGIQANWDFWVLKDWICRKEWKTWVTRGVVGKEKELPRSKGTENIQIPPEGSLLSITGPRIQWEMDHKFHSIRVSGRIGIDKDESGLRWGVRITWRSLTICFPL